MYEQIKSKSQSSGNKKIILVLTLSLVILAIVLCLFVWPFIYFQNYRTFVADLSNSTADAYEKSCLWAHSLEGDQRIVGSNIHLVYFLLTNAGSGRVCDRPEEKPEVTLKYADGSYMELWSVKLENPQRDREQGLLVSFVNTEGKRYTYDTDKLELDSFPLSKDENLPNRLK